MFLLALLGLFDTYTILINALRHALQLIINNYII